MLNNVVCRLCFDAWAWNADGVISSFIQSVLSFSLWPHSLSLPHIFPHHCCVSHYNSPFNLLTKDNPTKHQAHTHGAGLIHPSPCGKVPLTASCAQGLYFHTSIMVTLECSTANAQQVGPWRYVMLSDTGRSRRQHRRVCDYDKIVESGQTRAIFHTTENILSFFSA